MTPLLWVHGAVPLSNPPLPTSWSPQTAAAEAGVATATVPSRPMAALSAAESTLDLMEAVLSRLRPWEPRKASSAARAATTRHESGSGSARLQDVEQDDEQHDGAGDGEDGRDGAPDPHPEALGGAGTVGGIVGAGLPRGVDPAADEQSGAQGEQNGDENGHERSLSDRERWTVSFSRPDGRRALRLCVTGFPGRK